MKGDELPEGFFRPRRERGRTKDAQGKSIAAEDQETSNYLHTYRFGKGLSPGELELEFMINQPRHAEFIVKPPMARPALLQP